MGAVAKRLVFGHPAAAKRNHRTARQAERLAIHVDDLKIAFDSDWTIAENGDFGSCHAAILTSERGTIDKLHG